MTVAEYKQLLAGTVVSWENVAASSERYFLSMDSNTFIVLYPNQEYLIKCLLCKGVALWGRTINLPAQTTFIGKPSR